MRAEKTPQGMKGIFVSLTSGDVAAYRITLDAEGKELTRERLRAGGGMVRVAPPLDPNAPARDGRGRGNTAGPKLPVTRPVTDFTTEDLRDIFFCFTAAFLSVGFLNFTSFEDTAS